MRNEKDKDNEEYLEVYGTRFKYFLEWLENAGTNEALAEELDCSPGYVSQIKNGTRYINEKTARKWERLKGLELDYLDEKVSKAILDNNNKNISSTKKYKEAIKPRVSAFSSEEQKLIETYRTLDQRDKDFIWVTLDRICEPRGRRKKSSTKRQR